MKPNNLVNQCQATELTIQKLRSYTGFETISDEEAEEAILYIKRMAKVLFSLYKENEGSEKP